MNREIMANTRVVWLSLLAVLLVGCSAWSKVIYVDDDAVSPGDGTSWATAYRFLQDALTDAATAGEPVEIRVARGLYKPDRESSNPDGTRERDASFEVSDGIWLRGGFAGVGADDPNEYDTESFACVLSGDLNGDDVPVNDPCDLMEAPSRLDNAYHVVRLLGGVLEGVEVTGGYAHRHVCHIPYSRSFTTDHAGGGISGYGTVRDCAIHENYAEEVGGGLWCAGNYYRPDERPALAVQQCEFVGNATRSWGGGVCLMYCQADFGDCQFRDNWAGSYGGGGDFYSSDTSLLTCRFVRNEAANSGGGFSSRGLSSDQGKTRLTECVLVFNRSIYGGGGVSTRSTCELTACEMKQNTSDYGGALATLESTLILKSSLICGNQASNYGGALCVREQSSLECTNCTIVANIAPEGSCLALGVNSASKNREEVATLSNCVIRNEGQEFWNYDADVLIDYTNLIVRRDIWYDAREAVVVGEGNIDADPCFVDPGYWDDNGTADDANDDFFVEGDYHLKSQAGRWDEASGSWIQDEVTSLCIDAGDPNSPIGDEPFPNGGIVNMGACGGTAQAGKSYFDQPACETIIAGDLNGDCIVDLTDLTILMRHWLETGQ